MMQKKYPIKLHFGRGISRLSISLSTPIKLYFGRGFATLGKIVRDGLYFCTAHCEQLLLAAAKTFQNQFNVRSLQKNHYPYHLQ
jgi:hypothetical protein